MINTTTPVTPENRAERNKYPAELVETAQQRLGHISNSFIFLEQNPVVQAGLADEKRAETLQEEQLANQNSQTTDELSDLKQLSVGHVGESAVYDSRMDEIRQQIKDIYGQKTT